ncbi:hypothetical protein CF8_0193 [Aeromonas phage CF8]|nr:hypothetical protein CF8_0193 [Aeromonas phage CF8]
MSHVILALDYDDTLCKTGAYINEQIKYFFWQQGMEKEHQFILDNEDKMSTMHYPEFIKKHVNEQVIGPGLYMLQAKPTPLATRGIMRVLQDFKQRYPTHLKIVGCTHRGFHKDGERFTRAWLKTMMIDHMFDDLHMLDSKNDPNKVEFLKQTYPDAQIVLVDDNPLHDHDKIHPKMDELVIYDRENKYEGYKHQQTYDSIHGLIRILESKLVY